MSKSKDSSPTFFLETDDLTEEERSKAKQVKKGASKDKRPMDSDYLEETDEPAHTIKFNLHFERGIRNMKEEPAQQDRERFTLKRLFDAVSSGDVSKLQGLHEYLRKSMKRLTDSQYKSNGKTALLKALLNLKEGENDTIEHLLEIAEKIGDLNSFVNAAYTDTYYKGQTALHVAIERRSAKFVQMLVQKGADVHAKACGKFFQPNQETCFYFGRSKNKIFGEVHVRLHCTTHNLRRSYGVGSMQKYKLVLGIHGETHTFQPLLKHIVQREFKGCKHLSRKITEWAYGPVCSSLYDLASLDTYEKNSALEIIVYGSEIPNRLEMLNIEPFNRLIEEKWERFAKPMFLFNFIIYVFYLFILTAVAYHRKEGKDLSNNQVGYLLLTGHIITTTGALYFFIRGLIDMLRKHPRFQSLIIDGYTDQLFFLQAVLFLACALLYSVGRDEYVACLVLCLALSWVNLLYFSRGSKNMGIYSVMIQNMVLGEIRRFLVVYMVFLIGFSAAVVTLLDEGSSSAQSSSEGDCTKPSFKSIYYTTLELFKFTIGMGDLEFTDQYQYIEVFYVLLIIYIVMTYILMLNMLIALMNSRVEEMSEESTSIWKLQRAITTLDMEWILPHCLKTRLRCGEEKDLGDEQEPDRRWCFSVEEVNWNQWNRNLGVVTEDPGKCMPVPSSTKPQREPSRRGLLQTFSKRWTQRPQRKYVQELSPLAEASSSV
uniref:Transient receptor potential cation channel, subfamily V, member 1 n=1 Tax=Cyprinus carpio TaxID=7962 RepID=A0A8C2HRE9_CYPCA